MTIVHRTAGLMDIRAFTTMGISAKPNSVSPIGMFGTGLKYAVAVLVRGGARPVVWIGRDRYEFFSAPVDFRGKEFHQLTMRLQKWSLTKARNIQLPFTTEYGRNWKPWMAFRELEANTRDEGGETLRVDGAWEPYPDHTCIVVDDPEYEAAWAARDDVFLPGGLSVRQESEGLQVMPGPGRRLYYRGLRAMDTGKPTLFTYNVLAPIELTEDRTFKYEHQVREQLARHVAATDDEDLVHSVVTASKDDWEYELEFPNWVVPGETFHRVMSRHPKGRSMASGVYYGRYDRSPTRTPATAWDEHPRPWRVVDDAVVDANDTKVFDCPYNYSGRWELIAEAICGRLGVLAEDHVVTAETSDD